MFVAALFTVARTWKQLRCPSADEWIRKLWYIYTMEYYPAIKRNAFESVLMRWMILETIIPSKVSQKGKHQYSILMLLLLLNRFSLSVSVRPRRQQPARLPRPWDSPGKKSGVGCHFLLQCMKVKSESEVAQSCLTPSDPMDCSLPGSSVHGIFQATVLDWVAIAFSVVNWLYPNKKCFWCFKIKR